MADPTPAPIPPTSPKINWVMAITMLVSFLTWLGGQDYVAAYPGATMVIGFAISLLVLILRTFFNSGPTTLNVTKLIVIFALSLGALGASPLQAAPMRCVRLPDGTRQCVEPQVFNKMPLPILRGNFVKKLFGK